MEPTFEREVFTVSQLNQQVRALLEGTFPSIWVEGEISNVARPASGHLYFTIKDEDAQVRCAMFRNQNRLLDFTPEEGSHVVAQSRVSLYPGRGDYQLIVSYMEETGDGALRRAFELLKNKLAKEGLFSEEHKQPLPKIPQQVGIITSPTGAAVRDILSTLKRRFPSLPVIVYPTQVQGKEAATQIADAIEIANARAECDVLILSRGGGALEDLWPFNEEIVARAIYASEIPIVSGVGHEVDFTIADFVADHRAATPTAAAEMVSPDEAQLKQTIEKYQKQLLRLMAQALQQKAQNLLWLQKRFRHPSQLIQEQMQRVDFLAQRLQQTLQYQLQNQQHALQHLERALNTVSPYATLQRGYAIITDSTSQHVIQSTDTVTTGQSICAQVSNGILECHVDNIIQKDKP